MREPGGRALERTGSGKNVHADFMVAGRFGRNDARDFPVLQAPAPYAAGAAVSGTWNTWRR